MDEHKLQKSTSRLFVNPLDALAIYRRIKDLRAYFTQVVFWNLQHDLRNTVGRRLLDSLFDAVPLTRREAFRRQVRQARRDFQNLQFATV